VTAVTQLDGNRVEELPAPLELVLNVKSECLLTDTAMPKFLKSASTITHQCYTAPVFSTS
jgi:hypothetical protein